MYHREGVDALPAHLETAYGITVAKVHPLDVGVFRVDRSDRGTPLVVRLFSAARPYAAAEADLAVLRHLAEIDFPSERPFGDCALTSHEGQAVLVTDFVTQVAQAKRPAFPIVALGASIGRLHGLEVPVGRTDPRARCTISRRGRWPTSSGRSRAGSIPSKPVCRVDARGPSTRCAPLWTRLTAVMASLRRSFIPTRSPRTRSSPQMVRYSSTGPPRDAALASRR
ncbi:MAG: phosphotransferase [Acidimicrobiia bacterium]